MTNDPFETLGIGRDATAQDARRALAAKATALAQLQSDDTAIGASASRELRQIQDAYQEIVRRLTLGALHDEIQGKSPAHIAVIEVAHNVINTFRSMEDIWIDMKGLNLSIGNDGITPPESFYPAGKLDETQRHALIGIHRMMIFPCLAVHSDLEKVFFRAKAEGKILDLDRASFETARYATEDRDNPSREYAGTLARRMIKFIAGIDPETGPTAEQRPAHERYKNDKTLGFLYGVATDAIEENKKHFAPDIVEKLGLEPPRAGRPGAPLPLAAPDTSA
jgi:hypothetical protein